MECMASLFSLLFFSLIFIYLYWGIYIIKLNPSESMNKAFLGLCIAASIWSLGFAMANTAESLKVALLWRRFSAIGWTSLYAIMLHFLILFTRDKSSLKQKKHLVILYVPAAINMYIFVLSNDMAQIQYNLKKIEFGWVNQSVNNGWDFLFYGYYILYILIGLMAIWKWKQGLKDKTIARQGNLLILIIAVSLILGSLVDVVANSVLGRPSLQMGPIFTLSPIWAMYYSARYYGLMDREPANKDEIIVTGADQKKIFKHLAIAFCWGGVLSFVSEYMPYTQSGKGDLKSGMTKLGVLLSVGTSIHFLQKIKKESVKEALTIIVLVVSIPLVALQFINYSSITVWVFPIIIIISSLVFSKRTLLICSTIMAIITQRLIWILQPQNLVQLDGYDYMARMGMFVLAFLIGFYVNKIYVAKIKENKEQIKFQKMNSVISLEFVNINQENFDKKISKLLVEIGLCFKAERAYLVLFNYKDNTMTYSHEWRAEGVEIGVEALKEVPFDVLPWWMETIQRDGCVYIEDTDQMPSDASIEQEQLIGQKVKSLIAVGVKGEPSIQGFIGIDSVHSFKKWSQGNMKQLNIVSNIISHGLMKIKAEKEIEFMAYYDRLTGLPNRFLFKERAKLMIDLAKREGNFTAIIFMDLDNFKLVNDTVGHEGGDYLLQEVAQSLTGAVRKTDTVARFGGDEFMIALGDMGSQEDILTIARKIIHLFSAPFNIKGQDFIVTASAGIATYPQGGEDVETLIKNADHAMYKAKGQGKNQYALYTGELF